MFSRIRKYFNEYREIKYLAYHDSLTGLLNRNWLYKNLDSIDKCIVVFIDINNLKEKNINGHTAGDEHIKYVVHIIKNGLNFDDIFVRYAGDEFIVFTNSVLSVCENKLYSIGKAMVYDDIRKAIQLADELMIAEKNLLIKYHKNE